MARLILAGFRAAGKKATSLRGTARRCSSVVPVLRSSSLNETVAPTGWCMSRRWTSRRWRARRAGVLHLSEGVADDSAEGPALPTGKSRWCCEGTSDVGGAWSRGVSLHTFAESIGEVTSRRRRTDRGGREPVRRRGRRRPPGVLADGAAKLLMIMHERTGRAGHDVATTLRHVPPHLGTPPSAGRLDRGGRPSRTGWRRARGRGPQR